MRYYTLISAFIAIWTLFPVSSYKAANSTENTTTFNKDELTPLLWGNISGDLVRKYGQALNALPDSIAHSSHKYLHIGVFKLKEQPLPILVISTPAYIYAPASDKSHLNSMPLKSMKSIQCETITDDSSAGIAMYHHAGHKLPDTNLLLVDISKTLNELVSINSGKDDIHININKTAKQSLSLHELNNSSILVQHKDSLTTISWPSPNTKDSAWDADLLLGLHAMSLPEDTEDYICLSIKPELAFRQVTDLVLNLPHRIISQKNKALISNNTANWFNSADVEFSTLIKNIESEISFATLPYGSLMLCDIKNIDTFNVWFEKILIAHETETITKTLYGVHELYTLRFKQPALPLAPTVTIIKPKTMVIALWPQTIKEYLVWMEKGRRHTLRQKRSYRKLLNTEGLYAFGFINRDRPTGQHLPSLLSTLGLPITQGNKAINKSYPHSEDTVMNIKKRNKRMMITFTGANSDPISLLLSVMTAPLDSPAGLLITSLLNNHKTSSGNGRRAVILPEPTSSNIQRGQR